MRAIGSEAVFVEFSRAVVFVNQLLILKSQLGAEFVETDKPFLGNRPTFELFSARWKRIVKKILNGQAWTV